MSAERDGWDIFVSYASEDRVTFVRDLIRALRKRGLRVWWDRFNLRELSVRSDEQLLESSIHDGLEGSRSAVVVLSRYFVTKYWPLRELQQILEQDEEMRGINQGLRRIAPVLLNVSRDEVKQHCPAIDNAPVLDAGDGAESVC